MSAWYGLAIRRCLCVRIPLYQDHCHSHAGVWLSVTGCPRHSWLCHCCSTSSWITYMLEADARRRRFEQVYRQYLTLSLSPFPSSLAASDLRSSKCISIPTRMKPNRISKAKEARSLFLHLQAHQPRDCKSRSYRMSVPKICQYGYHSSRTVSRGTAQGYHSVELRA